MKRFIYNILLITLLSAFFASCGGDEPQINVPVNLKCSFTLPEGIDNGTLTDMVASIEDVNTGLKNDYNFTVGSDYSTTITVPRGMYRVTVTGKLKYNNGRADKEVEVRAYNAGIALTSAETEILLPLYMTTEPEPDDPALDYTGFVLAEIFCAGSATPFGTYYYADKYFVIYNNTDHVLYADSLVIAESQFLTVMKEDYNPDIMATDMSVGAIYMIPGKGHDVPVQPGGKILICDNALDHTEANPNSWDLSKADYEWYDESTDPRYNDIDNLDVPNLEKIYANTLTMWSPHTQGFRSYALARMHTSIDDYLTNYAYDYEYTVVGATGQADMEGYAYRLPNSWILDAVNVSVPSMFQWIVTDPSLDRGYTYCADFGWDDSRYNKSMRRKTISREGGRAILQDTNDSSVDFESRATANPFYEF